MEDSGHARAASSHLLLHDQLSRCLGQVGVEPILHPSEIQTPATSSHVEQHQKPPKLLVALSGGIDSVVLLHALLQSKNHFQFELYAIHVHHGISEQAESWAEFCLSICSNWNVPIHIARIHVSKLSKKGIEAEARHQRYLVIEAHQSSIGADWVVLAHHQQDQAETLLLQAIRGSGVKGLASMASIDNQRKRLRPFLPITRDDIQTYASVHELSWINDESNFDTHYDRNYLRHTIFPRLKERFPSVDLTLSRVAKHMAESLSLLNELAEADFTKFKSVTENQNKFPIAILTNLDRTRAKNVFRWWLQHQSDEYKLNERRINTLISELQLWRNDDHFSLKINDDVNLKRYEDGLYLVKHRQAVPFDLMWQYQESLSLPNGSQLKIQQTVGSGLSFSKLLNRPLRVTNRKGGEMLLWQQNRPHRSLKVIFQMTKTPPWTRDRIPLVYVGDTLICIPNIAIDERYMARGNEPGLMLNWHEF